MSSKETSATTADLTGLGSAQQGALDAPGLVRLHPEDGLSVPPLITVEDRIVVGREDTCKVQIVEQSVSRRHAVVERRGEALLITDLGSHNGTFVDRDRLEAPTPARPHQVVRFGRCVFLVVESSGRYLGWLDAARSGPIVGGPAMGHIRLLVQRFGSQHNTVLITGETGTGKEVIARALHACSGRSGSFVAVNCAAVPDELFEAHLFGFKKGAFSGADRDELGYFRAADGGTLFLDEVGELSQHSHAKLLRALETGQVNPVGTHRPADVDVRIVAATNRDLEKAVADGSFRSDLYTRLRVLTILVPPLRERPEDVSLLASRFLQEGEVTRVTHEAIVDLSLYAWPGNVRELRNALVEAAAHARADDSDAVSPRHLRPEITSPPPRGASGVELTERSAAIITAMKRTGGNVSAVAAELGLHRAQIYIALEKAGLKASDFR